MGAVSTLNFKLLVTNGQFTAGMAGGAKSLDMLNAKAGMVTASIGSKLMGLAAIATTALGGLSVGKGIRLAADFEDAQVSMGVLFKDAALGKQVLRDLSKFATETPFELPELQNAATKLAGFGVAGESIIPTLQMIGDTAAGVGAPINELAEVFGRNLAAGRLYTKDINEFQGRGIPIVAALGRTMGKSRQEVLNMVEAGKVGSAELVAAFQAMGGAGGEFAGLMEARSQTVNGIFSTLRDNVNNTLRDIGQTLIQEFNVKQGMKDITTWIQDASRKTGAYVVVIARWVKEKKELILTIGKTVLAIGAVIVVGGMLIQVVRGVVAIVRTATTAFAVMQAYSGPKAVATLAASALLAAGAVAYLSDEYSKLDAEVNQVISDAQTLAEKLAAADKAQKPLDVAAMKAKAMDESIIGLSSSLQEQIDSWGASQRQIELWRLAQQGATLDMQNFANVVEKANQLDALERAQKRAGMSTKVAAVERRFTDGLTADIVNPVEKISSQVSKAVMVAQKIQQDVRALARAKAPAVASVGG